MNQEQLQGILITGSSLALFIGAMLLMPRMKLPRASDMVKSFLGYQLSTIDYSRARAVSRTHTLLEPRAKRSQVPGWLQ